MDETTTQNLSQWQTAEELAAKLQCHASTLHRKFGDGQGRVRWRGYVLERREATGFGQRQLNTRARFLYKALLPNIEESAQTTIPDVVELKVVDRQNVPDKLLAHIMESVADVNIPEPTDRRKLKVFLSRVGRARGSDNDRYADLWQEFYEACELYLGISPHRANRDEYPTGLDYIERCGKTRDALALAVKLYGEEAVGMKGAA